MTRLRVALDGRPLQSEPLGGVGRYIAGILPFLAEQADIAVLLDGRAPRAREIPDTVEQVALSAPRGVPGLGWLELAVAPWLRGEGAIFHATFNMLPLSFTGRSVVTLYDLAPQLHAEDFGRVRRAAWQLYIRISVARASAITTISQFVKGEIVQYFGVNAEGVHVAPVAVGSFFAPERAGRASLLLSSLGIEPPYVIAIGGAPRRGLPVAIEAWRRATRRLDTRTSLVIVGEPGLPSDDHLVSLGHPDDDSWATLLAGAQALCYPTRYEGFGLPALEAAASGTPVVCARVASLPEVLGDAGCWVESASPGGFADVLVRLLSDRGWHRERREAGLERVRRSPTWADSARELLAAYAEAAG